MWGLQPLKILVFHHKMTFETICDLFDQKHNWKQNALNIHEKNLTWKRVVNLNQNFRDCCHKKKKKKKKKKSIYQITLM